MNIRTELIKKKLNKRVNETIETRIIYEGNNEDLGEIKEGDIFKYKKKIHYSYKEKEKDFLNYLSIDKDYNKLKSTLIRLMCQEKIKYGEGYNISFEYTENTFNLFNYIYEYMNKGSRNNRNRWDRNVKPLVKDKYIYYNQTSLLRFLIEKGEFRKEIYG